VQTVLYGFEIAIGLGLIIFVHELGHFLTAKMFGVRAPRFGFGLPFTRPILKWTYGETEYGLYPVLIGGFVHLVGESPDAEDADDPRGLWRRPAWQRIVVFSAGVVMNALLALVFFALAPIIGIEAIVPVAGGVLPGMPAEKAGILPGDRLVAIDGHPVESFEDLLYTVGLSDAGTPFKVVIERPGAGSEPAKHLTLTIASFRPPESLFPMLGIEMERSTTVIAMRPDSLLHQAGVEVGDRILAVNGKEVVIWRDLTKVLADAPAGPLTLSVDRGGERQELRVAPADLKTYEYGMEPPTEIGAVEVGSPAAEAGVKPGDRVMAVQDKRWPTDKDLVEAIKAAGKGAEIRLALWRDGKAVDVTCKAVMMPGSDHPRIGISMGGGRGAPVQVGHVEPDGPAAAAGLASGDIILAAGDDGRRVDDWVVLSQIFINAGGKKIPLKVQQGGKELTTTLRPKAVSHDRLTLAEAIGEPLYAPLPRIYNPITAAQRGLRQTVLWLGRVYLNLKQFMVGQVSSKAYGGPVAIVQWSVSVASHGVGTFMDFLGMLTVSIAVLNFLPVPPFDGGHVLFVLIDSIKRKPVSMKLRTIVWIAGWGAVVLLLIVITYHDILRWVYS